MIDLNKYFKSLSKTELGKWTKYFQDLTNNNILNSNHGDLNKWTDALNQLPKISDLSFTIDSDIITATTSKPINIETKKLIESQLKVFNPWRKGPFDICGIFIKSEWRSDFKWNRLKDKISSLQNKLVLDVGCGNGYHCLRAAGCGAKFILGIDHKLNFFIQNQALLKFIKIDNAAVLPIGLDQIPNDCNKFDTIFSMGVLYHARTPFEHLLKLNSLLRNGGELILETLIIDGENDEILIPKKRYARMSNVRHIPTTNIIIKWLKNCGFKNITLIDKTFTSFEEQSLSKKWGIYSSLEDFIDKEDTSKTIEGLPAPYRAIFTANS